MRLKGSFALLWLKPLQSVSERSDTIYILRKRFISIIITIVIMIAIPAQTALAVLGDRTLSMGDQGYDVEQLQRDLGYLGYPVGQADGIYGWNTFQAVKSFQVNNGLVVDGITGKETAQQVIKQVSTPATNNVNAESVAVPTVQVNSSRGSSSIMLSQSDIYDLARLVYGEARGECFEGQVAIVAVVLNRLKSDKFGNSVKQVIYESGAFTAVSDGQFYMEPDNSSYQAVQAALRGWDPTGGAIYYWNPVTATNKWVWSRTIIKQIGKHVFAI
ncbi:MAG: spore cortex-lytic enzyme [Syntrophomonadaceae bacterium]|jgi:N-acetylmuramoyl-L-alanine amidase|nr:spore cortex-lytic enzyme [Bacillota bacterium]HQA49358.1 spore cortex-lytic enzyme [Syntrophomonadaceae bacterium]HQD89745.1 spore cortex-lytic enzyme [Syntrophomonadaceae bacterium]